MTPCAISSFELETLCLPLSWQTKGQSEEKPSMVVVMPIDNHHAASFISIIEV